MRLTKETPNGCEAVQEVQADSRRNRIHRVDDQTDGVKSMRYSDESYFDIQMKGIEVC